MTAEQIRRVLFANDAHKVVAAAAIRSVVGPARRRRRVHDPETIEGIQPEA